MGVLGFRVWGPYRGFVLDMPPPPLGMTVAALQGLLNKKLGRPAVFLRKMPADADWFKTAIAMEPSLREVTGFLLTRRFYLSYHYK